METETPSPPLRKRPRFWSRILRLLGLPFAFFREFRWKKQGNAWRSAWTLIGQWWSLGAAGKTALLLFAALLGSGIFFLAESSGVFRLNDLPRELNTPLILDIVMLGLFVLAWSAATGAAIALPAWGFLIASAWLVYYQMLVTSNLISSPGKGINLLPVLPTLWLGWLAWRKWTNATHALTFLAGWLVTSLGIAIVTAGPSGLRSFLGLPHWQAWSALAGIIALAGWIAGGITKSRPKTQPSFTSAFFFSLLLLGVLTALGAWRDRAGTIDWTHSALDDLSGTALFFWLWAGGGFTAGAIRLADWGIRRGIQVFSIRTLAWLAPLLIAAVTLGEWLWFDTHGREALMDWKPLWLGAVSRVNPVASQVLSWHWPVGLVFLTLWLLPPPRRGFSVRSVASLLMWWIVLGLALHGILSAATALVREKGAPGLIWWQGALVVVFLGLLREIGGLQRNDPQPSRARLFAGLGWTIAVMAMAVALSGTSGQDWNTRQALSTLNGMVHLGLPMAFFTAWERGVAPSRRLSLPAKLGFFAAGNVAAWLLITVNSIDWRWLLPGIPILVLLLRWLQHERPSLHPAAGAFAGSLFGAGVVTGWMMPGPPSIPFLPVWQWFAPAGGWENLHRDFGSSLHLLLLAGSWCLGGFLGWLAYRKSPTGSAPFAGTGINGPSSHDRTGPIPTESTVGAFPDIPPIPAAREEGELHAILRGHPKPDAGPEKQPPPRAS